MLEQVEIDIISMLINDMSPKAIANKLSIGKNAYYKHYKNILDCTECWDDKELKAWWSENSYQYTNLKSAKIIPMKRTQVSDED